MINLIKYIPVANSFVGLRIIENQIYFYYPESFNFCEGNEKENREQILKILKTLTLTKKSLNNDTLNSKFACDQCFPLLSYLWLIHDYSENHRYFNREKTFSKDGNGKINWKKTINQIPFCSNENFVFPYFIKELKTNKDLLITDIYKYCVSQSIKIIGWLFNIPLDSYLQTRRYNINEKNINLFIGEIRKELLKTFEDNKRLRLSHMLNVLTGLDSNQINSKELIFGVDKYDYIYEQMLDNIFSNVDDIKQYYPSANWSLITDHLTKKSSNLRPDTIMLDKDNKKAFILDAKYYRFGTTFVREDLPETSSIQKQVTYGEYVKNVKLKDFMVYNAFLMPYNRFKENDYNFKGILEFIGIAKTDWKNDNVNKKVVGVLIDMNFIIDSWTKKNTSEINALCELIEESTLNNKIFE